MWHIFLPMRIHVCKLPLVVLIGPPILTQESSSRAHRPFYLQFIRPNTKCNWQDQIGNVGVVSHCNQTITPRLKFKGELSINWKFYLLRNYSWSVVILATGDYDTTPTKTILMDIINKNFDKISTWVPKSVPRFMFDKEFIIVVLLNGYSAKRTINWR